MQEVAMYPTKAVEASMRYCLGSIFKKDSLSQATLVISAGSEAISTVTNSFVSLAQKSYCMQCVTTPLNAPKNTL